MLTLKLTKNRFDMQSDLVGSFQKPKYFWPLVSLILSAEDVQSKYNEKRVGEKKTCTRTPRGNILYAVP